MGRQRKPLTVYLLPTVRSALKERADGRRKGEGTVAAEILTRELLLPPAPKPAGNTGNLTAGRG